MTIAVDSTAIPEFDTGDIRTVCLALGPYRNLTTLAAALLFLHPQCQVLNHGSDRVLDDPDMNFLASRLRENTDSFIRHAVAYSKAGQRGRIGGSILLSHAFDRGTLRETYHRRFGDALVKQDIRCLFWKESHRVSVYLRQHAVDFDELFRHDERLRFLMPVRHPVDCALSNIRDGRAGSLLPGSDNATLPDMIRAVLGELLWFVRLQEHFPDRFFCFLENAFDRNTLQHLAAFLRIDPDDQWFDDVLANYTIRHPYKHSPPDRQYYRNLVQQMFHDYPIMRDKLTLLDDSLAC
jgi:hypothetical protein